MPANDMTVRIRTRYTRWASFVLSAAALLWRIPGGKTLSRVVYLVCAFQMRCEGQAMATPWHWVRVPYPTPTEKNDPKKVSA